VLNRLYIQNYALIQELDLDLKKGFTAITGETGSGKSILLGALGLVLGERADIQVLFDKDIKCIVEAEFDVQDLELKELFKKHDLDYLPVSTLRREINPAGRSRAFVNDTPVQLSVLRIMTESLVDIHSQHQTLLLGNDTFQLELLDHFANHKKELITYNSLYSSYRAKKNELRELKIFIQENSIDKDYLEFQLQELNEIHLRSGEDDRMREELGLKEHAEEIKAVLNQAITHLSSEKGLLDQLNSLSHRILSISSHTKGLDELSARLESVRLELDDISQTAEDLESQVEVDPERQQVLNDQLDALQRLLSKHRVADVDALIQFKIEVEEKLKSADEAHAKCLALEEESKTIEALLKKSAEALSTERTKAKQRLIKEVSSYFDDLSLFNAKIDVDVSQSADYKITGYDDVNILFNANKGGRLELLTKVASGGELSRLMLILKSQLAKAKRLPTLIFDEIDTGVSGEIASQMAAMLREMSEGRQVISITHLPQVAARASQHLKISKSDTKERSITDVACLDEDGRILELAKMLSGTKVSEASVANAKDLLKN
jgi:DNA repair protein RecN (Recombination protein N)